jgi:hypothetical protein
VSICLGFFVLLLGLFSIGGRRLVVLVRVGDVVLLGGMGVLQGTLRVWGESVDDVCYGSAVRVDDAILLLWEVPSAEGESDDDGG